MKTKLRVIQPTHICDNCGTPMTHHGGPHFGCRQCRNELRAAWYCCECGERHSADERTCPYGESNDREVDQ